MSPEENDSFVKWLGIALIVILLTMVFVPIFFSLTEIKVGDTLTTNQETPVYESYQPDPEGVVCKLPSGSKVVIRSRLTSNDLTNNPNEQTTFTALKAYLIEAPTCSGWVLPDYLDR